MTLTFTGAVANSWSNNKTEGFWMGVGFGYLIMKGSDIYTCEYLYDGTASATNKMTCNDRYGTGDVTPALDSSNNVVTLSSLVKTKIIAYTTNTTDPTTGITTNSTTYTGKSNLTVTFERLLYATGTNDYSMYFP